MKKQLILFCAVLLALCLLAGCAQSRPQSGGDRSVPNNSAAAPDTEAGADETAAPQTEALRTDAPESQAPETEAHGTEAPATQAPVTDAPETEALETEVPETEAPETDAPAEDRPVFVQEADYFTNGIVKIWEESGIVFRQDLDTGPETVLFRLEKNDEIVTKLFGVTDERLYFGWNEVEDWWGYNIYSVDYQGQNRTEYGPDWDPMFDGGWLLLYGFRSDVSATELRVIDRDDMLLVDLDNVWDGVVAEDGCYYFVYGGELPEDIGEWFTEHDERDVEFQILKLTPDGQFSIHGSLYFNTYYQPCFINFTTVGFPQVGEYYDLYTLEPVDAPVYG